MKLVLKSNLKKATEWESSRTCNYVLGIYAESEKLNCELAYYQMPAFDRRPEKLENYPVVSADSKCINWMLSEII
jgi:hypothetical protein